MIDVLIVGSGAGGSPLAFALSSAGFKVLVLEKGPRHSRSDYSHDELTLLGKPDLFVPNVDADPHVLIDHSGADTNPKLSMFGWAASCVGGGTTHMGGCLYRLHPADFRMHTLHGAVGTAADWPFSYDDLEPYYSTAEWEVGVSGAAGISPYEGARSRDYPMPPLRPHPVALVFDGAARRLGLHPFPTPRAINSRAYMGRPACQYCHRCGGLGCPTGARGSAPEALLSRAERTGNCEVRSGAMVRQITMAADGTAAGCIYIDGDGAEHRVSAAVVCVCCNAVESARLLLLSSSSSFPNGLGNDNGLVGRHLQFHSRSFATAEFKTEALPPDDGQTPALFCRSLLDHYLLRAEDHGLPKGGIQRFSLQRVQPIGAAQLVAEKAFDSPVWGATLKQILREYFRRRRRIEVEVFHDFFPNSRTFVELDPEVTDRWGLPSARISLAPMEQQSSVGAWLVERALDLLDSMGAHSLHPGEIGHTSGTTMSAGTCRAGKDPRTSVLNQFCQVHGVSNLFVVDGSFMPTSGGGPYTLTILANSFRCAHFIKERSRTGDL